MASDFLPMTWAEMTHLGWDAVDVLMVTGDAYVDHPAFGAALLGRWLASRGFRVGIVAQPRWAAPDDVLRLGRPRLFAGVTAGALDSMLAHYTAFRKKRGDDAYTPGGRAGARPNRAAIVYAGLVRRAFPGLPVVIGGIEASMRRAVHYDFWSDRVRRSILLDSKADLLVYGMAERALLEVAQRLRDQPGVCAGRDTREAGRLLRWIPGTVYVAAGAAEGTDDLGMEGLRPRTPRTPGTAFLQAGSPDRAPAIRLPSYEEIAADPNKLMTATLALEQQVHGGTDWVAQSTGSRLTVFAPPAAPLTADELGALYSLPFTRRAHPSYREPVPALEMIQFSVTTHRGCAGGCSFCSLALHQGRVVQSRSESSVVAEVVGLTAHADWKGSLTDVGGPTGNMWGAECAGSRSGCARESCLFPEICPNFRVNQAAAARLLRRIARVPGVKHVRVASGVRHDLALLDKEYVRALVAEFTGGQLKLAPEHCSASVLRLMRKPSFEIFERFLTVFERHSKDAGREQYLVPYLISAFPGCTDEDMRKLAAWLRGRGWRPQQVQCFVPTPGTVATAMYHAGVDPEGRPIPVAHSDAARLRQHGILAGTGQDGGHAQGQGRRISGTRRTEETRHPRCRR